MKEFALAQKVRGGIPEGGGGWIASKGATAYGLAARS
jgi:hypothetical protein